MESEHFRWLGEVPEGLDTGADLEIIIKRAQ
jgi:hypothetical protein